MTNIAEFTPVFRRGTEAEGQWRHRLLSLFVALIYGSALTSLPLLEFLDRENYLVYARFSGDILESLSARGPMPVIFNEPVWLNINVFLSGFFASEMVLRIFIFAGAFWVALLMLLKAQRYFFWMMVFLLIPQVIKNHIIHLRQGIGIAIFISGYVSGSKWLGCLLMILACFVHSSFFLLNLIFIAAYLVGLLQVAPRLRIIFLLLIFSLVGLVIVTIAGALGARQAALYADFDQSGSGLGLLFWVVALGLFLSSGQGFLNDNIVSLAIVAFYIGNYFTLPVAARVFESGLFIVLLSGFAMVGWRRQAFVILMLANLIIQYFTRYGEPWLGWGYPA